MRILISTDIEGVAGVVSPSQVREGNGEYERARRWMTEEANAAIAGAFAGGASEVMVADAHGTYRNLLADQLDLRARLVQGKPRGFGMLGGAEPACDAVMLIGFHARSQADGVLSHTINSSAFARVWVNDQELGEAGLYGALAGEFGVPVVFASGDDAFVCETQPLLPGCVFVTTKEATGRQSAISLAPQAACEAIRRGAEQSMANVATARPFVLKAPATLRLQVLTVAHADLFALWPTLQRLDTVTLQAELASVEHVLRVLNALSAMASTLH